MKIWIDDIRPAPEGYIRIRSVDEFKDFLENSFLYADEIKKRYGNAKLELIDIDHDAGEFYKDGGDYIRILDFLEEKHLSYPIHIHSMNPVGIQNMRRIIRRNKWKEV